MSRNLEFKIAMLGPQGVGKMSLISSLRKNATQLLEGSPVKIAPVGTRTIERFIRQRKELEAALRGGELHSGPCTSAHELFTYELLLDAPDNPGGIHFKLLDYPIGLGAGLQPTDPTIDWTFCTRWVIHSTVLIIPVDATVMMEAVSSRHRKLVPDLLHIHEISHVARGWAKARANRPHEPALLIMCPVKCESYFADNGRRRDLSAQLFSAIQYHYAEVFHAVREEARHAKGVYAPVDTIGCVELIKATWHTQHAERPVPTFCAQYRVRPPGHLSILGADAILMSMSRHLIEARHIAEATPWARNVADTLKPFAEKDEQFMQAFWLWLFGELPHDMNKRHHVQRAPQVNVELDKALAMLATHSFGPRVHEL